MAINDAFLGELNHEAATTRKMLERIPTDKFDWKPHDKSMTMSQLATHIADMFGWFIPTLEHDELDFAKGYEQAKPANTEELVAVLDKNVASANETLKKTSDETFMQNWRLRNGEQIFFELPRVAVTRTFIMNHVIHHRGQLAVYLRLNDIAVPSIYGPSADEVNM